MSREDVMLSCINERYGGILMAILVSMKGRVVPFVEER
jgi:hypothetical protein